MAAMRRIPSNSAPVRVNQFLSTLTHRHSDEIDQRLRALLNDDRQWRLVVRLSAFDRAHHLSVHDLLAFAGHGDPDLLRAALLHDVGKSDGVTQVRLGHRVGRVLGKRCAPALWERLAQHPERFRTGAFLAEHHARLGAEQARLAGASNRCCELILRHEDAPPTGDHLLDALIRADTEAIR